jgi:hypothetical protein
MRHLILLEKQKTQTLSLEMERNSKIRPEINEIDKKMYKESRKQSWFFEKINKVDKPLANLSRMRGEMTQINKSRDEKGNTTANTN